jgi:hypothetical protein
MFRFRVGILFVGLVLARTPIKSYADEPTSRESIAESPSELRLVNAYYVADLPVWKLRAGQPQFDASVVIAYLKNFVDSSTIIVSSAEDGMLEIDASESSHKIIRRALSPLWAFAGDVNERLELEIATARTSSQRVLIFTSDPNSAAVKKFFDLRFSDEQSQLRESLTNYIVQCIPSQQSELLERLGIKPPLGQDATLALLNADGTVSTQIMFADMESDGQNLAITLSEFLQLHRPTFPDARDELSSGYEQALRDQKRVLLLQGGPNCGPCVALSHFLEAKHFLLEKDYVLVKLDSRMPHASEVIEKIRVADSGPVPWMAVLAANGDVLATSDGPDGNIGYPRTEQNRVHFQNMLRETSQRLSNEEIALITKGLEPSPEKVGSAPMPTSPK